MEISIEMSPQHWCPNEGSNSELFDHENDALPLGPRWPPKKVNSFLLPTSQDTTELAIMTIESYSSFTQFPAATGKLA